MTRLRLLQLAAAGAVVAFVLLRSHPHEMWSALKGIDVLPALLALALNLPVLLLAPLRSGLVFRKLGHPVPAAILIPTTVLGFVAGGLTPAASGELLRAQALKTRAGVPFEAGVVAAIYERVLAMFLLALTTAVVFGVGNLQVAWAVALALTMAMLTVAPWVVATLAWRFLPGQSDAAGRGRFSAGLRAVLAAAIEVRSLLADLPLLLRWSTVTVSMFAVIALQYWALARAVGGGVSYGDAWLAFGISTFAGVIALIPLGLGILDSSLAATLDRLGMTLEQGAVVAVLVRALVTLPLVLAAVASYLYLQRLEVAPAGSPSQPALDGPAREASDLQRK